MSRLVEVHPQDPQPHRVAQVAAAVRKDGVIAYPTDSSYALGCEFGSRAGVERIRRIRSLDQKHHFTLVCADFAQIGQFTYVGNAAFRAIRAATPGPYTFILPATKEVPRRLAHPKKRTVGVRIPDHPFVAALLREMGEPLVSSSLLMPEQEDPMTEAWQVEEAVGNAVDVVVDAGPCGWEPTTVVDWSQDVPEVLRVGAGDPAPFE